MGTTPDGFGPGSERFFVGLAADNSREYFAAHRADFDQFVAEPMAALLESLPVAYQPFKTFRLNRDVRFSRDKSPYKTWHAAVHSADGVDHYLHIEAGGLLVGAGAYLWERDQLDRYREAVDDEYAGSELEAVLDRLGRRRSLEVGAGAEPLKTAPRGYPADHPRIALLRRKGLIASRTLRGPRLDQLGSVRRFVLDTFAMSDELNAWITRRVGPSTAPSPW